MKRLVLVAAALMLMAETTPVLPPDRETQHVVKAGETLSGIAQRAKVPQILIAEANRLEPPYLVRIGQLLVIPRTRHHTVVRGDTPFTIAYLYGVPWKDIAVANSLSDDAPLSAGQKLLIPTILPVPASSAPQAGSGPAALAPAARFAWPLSGNVRRGYAARAQTSNYHDGIDIRAAEGTAVRATAAGKIAFAGNEPQQFGQLVVIDHGNGWQSAYAFLSRITVKEGEDVRQGERIGLSGRTGRARGPELHFELRRDNRPVDPQVQLPRR
ncbi:MAG: peptidoglycan DD-metalloendopeptidase family protein [Novosphingobium sp.]